MPESNASSRSGDPVTQSSVPSEPPHTGTITGPPSGDVPTTHFSGSPPAPGPGPVPAETLIAGRYRLSDPLGEGGMGTVYRAEQIEPVRRAVAVKLIRAGLDSRAILGRFEAERQALALMDHPNIARVLDAGATDTGHPFFVMELVPGEPITAYCDARRLTPRQRLELFVPVCEAIQHAHQKGIIHRDIKPSNVLVAEYEGRPVPKVIDFGVAKATGGGLTPDPLHTGAGAAVGTPVYMSPEQAAGDPDVDTRSDVYALGVLLYELLTGTTPIPKERFRQAALIEMLRVVREEEPPRPSTRLTSTDAKVEIAAARGAEPDRLAKSFRGEVDWIVMKALEKERERRYDTPAGLARDVERYLADEVIEARPPSRGYRARKFLRKHRGSVLAAGAVVVVLAAGIVGTTIGLLRALRAEGDALASARLAEERRTDAENQRQQAEKQKQQAEEFRQQAEIERGRAQEGEKKAKSAQADAEAVLKFFQQNVLAAGRPRSQEGGLGRDVTLRQAIDAAEPKIGTAFKGRPVVEASVRHVLEMTYGYLGEYGKAIPQAEQAYRLRSAALGPDHPDTLESQNDLAYAYESMGDTKRAIPIYEDCLKRKTAILGLDNPSALATLNNLAYAYDSAGDIKRALPLYEDCYQRKRTVLGPDHPDTLGSLNNLATAYQTSGDLKRAVPLYEDCLKQRTSRLGPDHPDTLGSLNNLAYAYRSAGDVKRAIPLYEDCLKRKTALLGAEHPTTLTVLNNLASAYRAAGDLVRAVPLYEECLRQRVARLGREHPDSLVSMYNLGVVYRSAGRIRDAVPLFEEELRRSRVRPGVKDPGTQGSMKNLIGVYDSLGQYRDAAALGVELLALRRPKLPPDGPELVGELDYLAKLMLRAGSFGNAEQLLREATAIVEKSRADGWIAPALRSRLGAALLGQQRYADAEPLLLAGYEGLKRRQAEAPNAGRFRTAETADRLIDLYEATSRPDEANRVRAERLTLPPEPAPAPRAVGP